MTPNSNMLYGFFNGSKQELEALEDAGMSLEYYEAAAKLREQYVN